MAGQAVCFYSQTVIKVYLSPSCCQVTNRTLTFVMYLRFILYVTIRAQVGRPGIHPIDMTFLAADGGVFAGEREKCVLCTRAAGWKIHRMRVNRRAVLRLTHNSGGCHRPDRGTADIRRRTLFCQVLREGEHRFQGINPRQELFKQARGFYGHYREVA